MLIVTVTFSSQLKVFGQSLPLSDQSQYCQLISIVQSFCSTVWHFQLFNEHCCLVLFIQCWPWSSPHWVRSSFGVFQACMGRWWLCPVCLVASLWVCLARWMWSTWTSMMSLPGKGWCVVCVCVVCVCVCVCARIFWCHYQIGECMCVCTSQKSHCIVHSRGHL